MTTGDNPHPGQAATGIQHAAHGERTVVIGFWKDAAEPYWPDVHDFVDQTWDPAARAAVAARLRAGREVRQFRGHSTCRFCGLQNGTAELSDGTYLWPEGLAHYISDHQVRLPQPSETHFLTAAGHTEDAAASGRVAEADETWWLAMGSPTWT